MSKKQEAKHCPDELAHEREFGKINAELKAQLGWGDHTSVGAWPVDWKEVSAVANNLRGLVSKAKEHIRECGLCKRASENGYEAKD